MATTRPGPRLLPRRRGYGRSLCFVFGAVAFIIASFTVFGQERTLEKELLSSGEAFVPMPPRPCADIWQRQPLTVVRGHPFMQRSTSSS